MTKPAKKKSASKKAKPSAPMGGARTKERLADFFEPELVKKNGKLVIQCESEDEAILLAHELVRREWNASVDQALTGPITAFRVVDVVVVEGKIRPKKPRARR